MDFQKNVDSYGMPAAVLSVEKTPDGQCGDIRIVCANSIYKKLMGDGFYDDMIYSELIPKEANFEDFCYRCAVQKKHLHAYVYTKSLGIWTDGTYIPLSAETDKENLCYFMFFLDFSKVPEFDQMSNVSVKTAPFVIKTFMNLRSAENFYDGMNTVISDIQQATQAFCSSIIMIDKERNRYAPLCSKFSDDNASIDDYMPYLTKDVVFSWESTLEHRGLIIIKNDFDMARLEEENPLWVQSLRAAKVRTMIFLPLLQGKKLLGVLFITVTLR